MLERIRMWLAAVLVSGVAAAPVLGQGFGGFGDDFPPEVTVEVFAATGERSIDVAPGGEAVVAVVLDHAEGFHVWPSAEVELAPELDEFAIRTAIEIGPPSGVEVGPIQWPKPKMSTVPSLTGVGTMEAPTYAGRAVAFVPLRVADDATGRLDVRLNLTYQACDDQVCLAPEFPEFVVTLNVDPSAGSAVAVSGDFAAFDEAVFSGAFAAVGATGTPEPTGAGLDEVEQIVVVGADSGSFLGINFDTSGPVGFLVLAGFAILGGAVLNLTPCVLPVIPIKVMTLSRHAGESRGRAIVLGGAMALGVVAFWLALGIPAALVTSFADPSVIFSKWYVTAPLGLAMVLLALGLMGLFAINLPQSAYMINPKADNASGSFLFGAMTGVLGLPCFGFVAGGLIPAAARFDTLGVVVIFASLGVGMAAPYLVLSVFPKLVEKLPRTGPASELVKEVLGLLLIGFGLFFFGTGVRALVATHPYVADVLHLYGLSLAILAAGAWLLWRTIKITNRPLNVTVFGLAGALIAFVGVSVSLNGTLKAKDEYDARLAATEAAGPGTILTGYWNAYTPALLEKALGEGKVTFIDFTADWCINCKVFEAQVLDKEPTKSLLSDENVAMIKVDLTGRNPDGERLLSDLGRVGIPTWAVMGPGLSEPMIVPGFTPGAVREALEAAAGSAVASAGRADP